jgi:putative DNA primase/helicase
MNTIEQARGRWRDIHAILGVPAQFLKNKHGPCPMCGGRDRYRYDDKDGSGSYYCNQCGAGAGITLLMRLNKWDFQTACQKVDEVIGRARHNPVAPKQSNEKRAAEIQKILKEATKPEIVREYLTGRGLSTVPTMLRGHPSLLHVDEDNRRTGSFPCVVAPITGPDGRLQSAHRIYLADVKPKKKLMAPIETVSGAAARLFPAGEALGVSEGIETAIAAHELFNIPVWAAITATGIEQFVPPPGIKRLFVFADNDANFQGQKSAYALAHRLSVAQERATAHIEVQVPPKADTDWLDVLLEERA